MSGERLGIFVGTSMYKIGGDSETVAEETLVLPAVVLDEGKLLTDPAFSGPLDFVDDGYRPGYINWSGPEED